MEESSKILTKCVVVVWAVTCKTTAIWVCLEERAFVILLNRVQVNNNRLVDFELCGLFWTRKELKHLCCTRMLILSISSKIKWTFINTNYSFPFTYQRRWVKPSICSIVVPLVAGLMNDESGSRLHTGGDECGSNSLHWYCNRIRGVCGFDRKLWNCLNMFTACSIVVKILSENDAWLAVLKCSSLWASAFLTCVDYCSINIWIALYISRLRLNQDVKIVIEDLFVVTVELYCEVWY